MENERTSKGYVYVLINSSMPNLVKIGKTTKDPNERVKELSSATGVATPFTKSKINGRGYGFECYLLSINTDSYTAKGYYTVYLKAKTEHNYNINDSTVICIEY